MADTAEAMRAGGLASSELTRLFDAVLEFTSDSRADAVVAAQGWDGEYIGSGKGSVDGDRLRGTISWSLYAGDCLYPRIRKGHRVADHLHLCTLSPGGFLETGDGVRIRFDGRGYGLRTRDWYRVSASLTFATDSGKYAWLTNVLAVMEGDFDERAGRAVWRVYAPASVLG